MIILSDNELKQNKILLANFLIDKPIEDQYKIKEFPYNPFGFIYCIENKTTHRKYVGSVYSNWNDIKNPNPLTSLKKRASQYLYEYNKIKNYTSSTEIIARPIIKAMVEEGFDNFIMYPIGETVRQNHVIAEKYFIDLYDSVNNGYNVLNGGAYIFKPGNIMSHPDKLTRSDNIICIHLNNRQIIYSDSMKLFADYLTTTKDIIKNANRKGRTHKGWYIFYIDKEKRHYVKDYFVLGDGLSKNDRHSEKSKTFYVTMVENIDLYIDNTNSELFSQFEILSPLRYINEE